jgi:hypothetical protein
MAEDEQEKKRPEWTHKKEFGIVGEMRKVVLASKEVSEKELALLRRKLERLTYGS